MSRDPVCLSVLPQRPVHSSGLPRLVRNLPQTTETFLRSASWALSGFHQSPGAWLAPQGGAGVGGAAGLAWESRAPNPVRERTQGLQVAWFGAVPGGHSPPLSEPPHQPLGNEGTMSPALLGAERGALSPDTDLPRGVVAMLSSSAVLSLYRFF